MRCGDLVVMTHNVYNNTLTGVNHGIDTYREGSALIPSLCRMKILRA